VECDVGKKQNYDPAAFVNAVRALPLKKQQDDRSGNVMLKNVCERHRMDDGGDIPMTKSLVL
jgi:hypothetical protein